MSKIISLIQGSYYLPLLLLALVALKVFLFVSHKTESWRWVHLIRFDEEHILSSTTIHRKGAKRIQNYLSRLILCVILLMIAVRILGIWVAV